MKKILGKESSDEELNLRVKELQTPQTLDHPLFGTFTLDRALNWYEAKVEWNSQPIHLSLSRDDSEDETLLGIAKELWKKQKSWDRKVRSFAAQELLSLKNDTWLGEDEKEFTAKQFKDKMTLESMVIHSAKDIQFTFDDGNLFWGHVIQVDCTLKDGPTDAGIAG